MLESHVIDHVPQEKKIVENTLPGDAARLILVEDIGENLTYTIGQGFCRNLIVKVQE